MNTRESKKHFLEALDELEREKGIKKESLFEAIETAMLAAYKKNYGEDENVRVEMSKEDGEIRILKTKLVVEDDELVDENNEIAISDIKNKKKRVKVGDKLDFEVFCEDFRRNAIQNAKQIVIQKVRESERENIYEIFKEKEGELLTGLIRRIDERKNIFIEINGIELILPPNEQSMSDIYRVGERIKVYVMKVEKTNKFPKILISRKNEGLLRRLFELEIPEIAQNMIEIKSISREAGSRSKIAVHSNIKNIDIVGACVGQNGNRIKNIVDELSGEKIDIILWKEQIEDFVAAALAPAEVDRVVMKEDGTADVLVSEEQFSLAIGKSGQNARLAARLTGVRVDININQ